MKLSSIKAQEILDSRGNPTVKAVVVLEDGSKGWAAVPSGASTGKYEAVELRDGDKSRYNGTGVLQAVENVNTKIAQSLIGVDAADQRKIDQTMIDLDGTENKENLGANAILAVSLAVARSAAVSQKKELYEYLNKFNPDFDGQYIMPIPEMNVMNGGKHANWATDIQEYMLFPLGAPSTTEAIRMTTEVYHILKRIIKDKGYATAVGDEGGFAPNVASNEEPFELLAEAVEKAGYHLGKDIVLGIDAAASEFYENGKYQLNKEGKTVTSDEWSEILVDLTKKYPILSMEDIFDEDDWEAYQKFTSIGANSRQIVGDDLYVTNIKRLQTGIDQKSSNSILIKLNQIGTLSETVDAVLLARKNGMTSIISHRSGETEDPFIADFAVAMGTGQIKTGAPARSERVAKYNRLMEIEAELGDKAQYAKFPFISV
jgi:enolase